MKTPATSPKDPLPDFILGDDCLGDDKGTLYIAHLKFPVCLVRVRHSPEQGVNQFHPQFLEDDADLTPELRKKTIAAAVIFYNKAWRRALATAIT